MSDSSKNRAAIFAAGGIVVRHASAPLIAVVRPRKQKAWVLPKGKLKPGEASLDAAKREAEEETGQDVSVHEFLGTMSYVAGGRSKIVQFWCMRALGASQRELMPDIKAVKWLPLDKAVAILTREHEKAFLEVVGPIALNAIKRLSRSVPKAPAVRPEPAAPPPLPLPAAAQGTRPSLSFPLVDAVRGWFGAIRSH